jgi:YrbI family 3-deoxy-D-manno-octulosonate 8-phosphate phosphatase
MIKLLLLDIDGVLTDGKVTVDSKGNEYKTISFKDIDAIFEAKRKNILVGLITGEDTPVTLFFRRRFKPDFFYKGCKDKVRALKEIMRKTKIGINEICYIGDSKHDIPVMKLIKFSACPSDALTEVKRIAKIRLKSTGGEGCVREVLTYIFNLYIER